MASQPDLPAMSYADAAARLRYVSGVRARARRAVLLPTFGGLAGLGAVLATHGLLTALFAHRELTSAVWMAGIVVARPALRRQWRGPASGAELLAAARLWLGCALAAVAVAVAASAAGLDPIVAGIAAAVASRAALARMAPAALVAVAGGAVVEALLAHGVPTWAGEVVAGAGLIAAGLAARAAERRAA